MATLTNLWRQVLFLTCVVHGFSDTAISAGPPLIRDDFICYDTAHPQRTGAKWPSIAMDAQGNLNVIHFVWGGTPTTDLHQYVRFDPTGQQVQPALTFLPDTLSDSIWYTNSYYVLASSDAGRTVISYFATMLPSRALEEKVLALVVDDKGALMGTPVCFTCDSGYTDLKSLAPRCGINDSGIGVLGWFGYRSGLDTFDSVFIRMYDTNVDTLGPLIEPLKLPQPPIDLPGYDGNYDIHNEPAIAIAEDGSFVVVWVAKHGYNQVFYLPYNPDGTPKSEIRIANCLGSFVDTALCACKLVNTVNVAMESDGDFSIVWSGNVYHQLYHYTRKHIWMRGFHADGTPKYDPIRVNDADSMFLMWFIYPKIACDDSGNVLIGWADSRLHSESFKYDAFAQKVDPEGNLVGYNMRMNNVPGFVRIVGGNDGCDMNDAGQAVFIWAYHSLDYRIYAQLMPYEMVGTFTPGDINADLSGDVADLTTLVDYIFFGAKNTFWPRHLVDFDGDGWNGSVADLTYLVAWIFSGGPEPRTPDPGVRAPTPLPQ